MPQTNKKLIIIFLTAIIVMVGVLGAFRIQVKAQVTTDNPTNQNEIFIPYSDEDIRLFNSIRDVDSLSAQQLVDLARELNVLTSDMLDPNSVAGGEFVDNVERYPQIRQALINAIKNGRITIGANDQEITERNEVLKELEGYTSPSFVHEAANAPDTPSEPNIFEILGNIIGWILYWIVYGLSLIVAKEVDVLLAIMSYPINLSLDVVSKGWEIVRDVCNNFFIVIMLAIAVGTVFRIPSYRYKDALPKLLIAAILVNFSKLIAGVFIDVSQILMLSFAAPLVTIQGNNIILAALGLPDLYNFMGNVLNRNEFGIGNVIVVLLWGVIVSFVAFIVIACIIAILIVRIVYLLFLAILSPLPFFFGSLDRLKGYGKEWWDLFTKYLIVGPAMLFFLWISFTIMGFNSQVSTRTETATATGANVQAGLGASPSLKTESTQSTDVNQREILSQAMTTEGMINFGFVIVLLVLSLVMGQRFGGAGAKFAGMGMSFLDKQRKKVTSLPGRAAGYGAKQVKRAGLAAGLAVGKGVLGTGLAVTRGLDASLGGWGAWGIGKMRSKGGVATGAVAGAALGTIAGPLGAAIGAGAGAVMGGFIGKKLSTNMTNWRRQKDSLLSAQGKGDKGRYLDENGKEIKAFDSSGTPIAAELAKIKYQWDDKTGGYYEADKTSSFNKSKGGYALVSTSDKYKEDDGTVVHRWGEYKDSKGDSYRRYNSDDKGYYRVNSAGEFIDKKGTVTTDEDKFVAAASELIGGLKAVRQMSDTGATYYANYAASKSKGWAAADAAIDKKVSDAQSAYNRMSEEMLNKLIQTESDDAKKMAMALTLATKSGFKDSSSVLAAKQSFGGNQLLLKKFNDEMNQRNMILNNTQKDGRLDEAAIAKLISSGKADWHKQDPKYLNKEAVDLMSKQLGHEFESNIEKMMKTDKDRKLVISAMEKGLDGRSFTDRDLDIRKAYAKASGNWQKGFTDSSSGSPVVNTGIMTDAIRSIKSPGVFDDVKNEDMNATTGSNFRKSFVAGVSVKMLNQMMRSDKISSAKFTEFLKIIKDEATSGNANATALVAAIGASSNHDLATEYRDA